MARRFWKKAAPYVLMLPFIFFIVLFLYGVVNAVLQGLGIMPSLGLETPTTQYYEKALSNPNMVKSLVFSLTYALTSSVLAVVLGVIISAAVCRSKLGQVGQIAGIQIPIMTAHTIVVLFVIAFFASSGLIPRLLFAAGIIGDMTDFPSVLGAPTAWGIVLVYLWKEAPFVAFSTITLMAHIGDRYSEAAACLGASPLQTFFRITLPLCKSAVLKAFLIIFAFAFGSYEVPFLLGPSLPKALPVLAFIEYGSPELLNRPYAMAINGIMVAITLIIAIIYYIVMVRERKVKP